MAVLLSNQDREFIKTQLIKKLPAAKYYIFGSRVMGNAKPSSDLDTIIVSDQAVPLNILSDIKEVFSESNLPFKVDIVDWHRISKEFQDKIQREWELL